MCSDDVECIGPGKDHTYTTPCPLGSRHCIDQISPEDICKAVQSLS
jgi:hypothetical protein